MRRMGLRVTSASAKEKYDESSSAAPDYLRRATMGRKGNTQYMGEIQGSLRAVGRHEPFKLKCWMGDSVTRSL